MRYKKGLLIATACLVMGVTGCGKANKETIADEFKEIQVTEESTGEGNQGEQGNAGGAIDTQIPVTVNGAQSIINVDISGVDTGVDKVFAADKKDYDDSMVIEQADKFFGAGNYEILTESTEGVLKSYDYGDYGYEEAIFRGKVGDSYYTLRYFHITKGYSAGIAAYTVDRQDSEDTMLNGEGYMMETGELENGENNTCDFDDAHALALDWIDKLGYGDNYDLVKIQQIRESAISMAGGNSDWDGYLFTFSRKIDKKAAGYFINDSFASCKADGTGIHDMPEDDAQMEMNTYDTNYGTNVERVQLYITSKGLVTAVLPEEYILKDAIAGKSLISIDEALKRAGDEINQWDEDMLGFCFDWGEKEETTFRCELAYIPLDKDNGLEYTPVYLLIWDDLDYGETMVMLAISAENGTILETYYTVTSAPVGQEIYE